MELTGRTVLLTGATGGIGHAIARAVRQRGGELVLSGRRRELLEPLARETGGRAVAADLRDRAGLARLAQDAGDVDVLVANAGLSASGRFFGWGPDEIAETVAVNLTAPLVLARLLAEPMAARGSGHIVLMSSLSGMSGQPGASVYSASKFGLRGLGQALRAELRPVGVGVSTVLPGFVRDAGMFHRAGARAPWYLGTVSPERVAAAVVRAVERNRAEILVGSPLLRAMTQFAAAAPGPAATFARLVGGDRITARIIGDLEATHRPAADDSGR